LNAFGACKMRRLEQASLSKFTVGIIKSHRKGI
jgi:hypothetical protein